MKLLNNPITLGTLSALAAIPMSAFAADKQQPNIIIFLIDDMGVMDTSVPFIVDKSGNAEVHPLNEWYRTPNMERLANQGVRFSSFYAQSVSSPSRTSILTGQNSTRHHTTTWIYSEQNNRGTFGPEQWNWEGLTKSDVTLPRLLQKVGYKTIHIGKAHFGPIGAEGEDPTNIGFDVNIGGSSIGQPGSYYGEDGYGHIKGSKSRAVPHLENYHGSKTFLTEALTIEANKEISKSIKEKKPFFLNFAHYAVHAPFMADKQYLGNYTDPNKTAPAKAYATLIEGMDKSLGDLMNHLEAEGVAENTIILFLGDNGGDAPLGAQDGHTSSAPLRGKKGTEYEGGVRIPFIASWAVNNPKNKLQKETKIAQNSIQTQLGTIMDIFPTLADMAGAEIPKEHLIDGTNIEKQLAGKIDKKRSEKVLMHFPHDHRGSYFTTLIDGDWKLIYYYNPKSPSEPRYQLFNLAEDRTEQKNLASTHAEKLVELMLTMTEELKLQDSQYPIDESGKTLIPVIPVI